MEKTTRAELKNQTVSYITGALGLVAGLAWNDAIRALIDAVFPVDKSNLWIKFIYAAIVTLIVVLLGHYIFKSADSK